MQMRGLRVDESVRTPELCVNWSSCRTFQVFVAMRIESRSMLNALFPALSAGTLLFSSAVCFSKLRCRVPIIRNIPTKHIHEKVYFVRRPGNLYVISAGTRIVPNGSYRYD